MRTGNPALNDKAFDVRTLSGEDVMTVEGTAGKTLALLAVLLVAAAFTWSQTGAALSDAQPGVMQAEGYTAWLSDVPSGYWTYVLVGLFGGLVVAFITIFNPRVAPYTAPLYAGLEGIFLGAFSAVFEYMYPGIVIQAVGLTFGTLATLLIVYRLRIVRATENFKMGVIAATGGIFLLYLASMILSLFGIPIGFLHSTGWLGIGFSLFVVVIAALNLVLDFDFIENGAARGAPKYME